MPLLVRAAALSAQDLLDGCCGRAGACRGWSQCWCRELLGEAPGTCQAFSSWEQWRGSSWAGNKLKQRANPCAVPACSQPAVGASGGALPARRAARLPQRVRSPGRRGWDLGTGCSPGRAGGVPAAAGAGGAGPRSALLRSSGRASPGEGCQAGLPARAAPRRRAARPPRHSWQAAGGSEDAGPAPLGSNYLPAASGPNPLTRRVRSRLTKQGSIRLKCEVGISRKNESVVIAPASPPGRPPARRALAGEIKAAGICLPEWAPHWEAVSNSFARAPR